MVDSGIAGTILACKAEIKTLAISKRALFQTKYPMQPMKIIPLDRVLAIRPESRLRHTASTDDRERGHAAVTVMVCSVTVAVQPEADAAALGHGDYLGQVTQSMIVPLRSSAGQAERIMGYEDAWPGTKTCQ